MTVRSALGALAALSCATVMCAGSATGAPAGDAGPAGGSFPGLQKSSVAAAHSAMKAHGATAARPAAAALPSAGSWAIGYSAVTRFIGDQAQLDLVGPSGGVAKAIATLSTDNPLRIHDARYDGRSVITGTDVLVNGRAYTRYTVYDLTTGGQTSFSLPGEGRAYYTNTGILTVERPEDGPARTSLRDASGRWQKTLTLSGWGDVEVSPGGTLLMEATDRGVVLRRASDGSLVRTVPAPAGMPDCTPLGLWGQGYVKMTCTATSDLMFERGTPFAVSTTTGKRVQLAPAGYFNAWPTGGRRSVEKSLPDGAQIGSLSGSTFSQYLPTAAPMQIGMGAHGSSMWIGDAGEGWVKRYDVQTRNAVTVAGPGSEIDGYVVDGRLIDTVS